MNNITISGVVATDPEVRFVDLVSSQTPVCRFLLSVVEWNGSENKLEAEIWGANAEQFQALFRQGQSGVFMGKLRIESRESPNGTRKVPQLRISNYFKTEDAGIPNQSSSPVESKKSVQDSPPFREVKTDLPELDDIPF